MWTSLGLANCRFRLASSYTTTYAKLRGLASMPWPQTWMKSSSMTVVLTRSNNTTLNRASISTTPTRTKDRAPSKVLVLGSGGLSIGQPASLDVYGVQTIHAFKEEGISTVLMNPNIAAMQTDDGLADTVYFVPITPDHVEQVLQRETPDSVLFTFGGQAALCCGLEVARRGIFEKYKVRVLGSPVESLLETVHRPTLFRRLNEIYIPLPENTIIHSIDDALQAAQKIGYPVTVRQIDASGTWESELAHDELSLRGILARAFLISPRWIIEKSMEHWKSVEIEILRDGTDTCLPVCHMESFDPVGIHPGNSILVAPSQTLTPTQIRLLEEASIEIVRHLNLRGTCNLHFAVEPDSERFRLISVNPRISRTTTMASKASGLICSYAAAKISLYERGAYLKRFVEMFAQHQRDYLVCRVPRFDLKRFHLAKRELGTALKSVGEAIAIGRTFAEALQKAIRMVNPEFRGFDEHTFGNVQGELRNPTDRRLFAIVYALTNHRYTPEQVHAYTGIDMWFLKRLATLGFIENRLREHEIRTIPEELLAKAKRAGFSDSQIAGFLDVDEMDVRRLRIGLSIIPKMIESSWIREGMKMQQQQVSNASTPSASTSDFNKIHAGLSFHYATYHGTEDPHQHQQPLQSDVQTTPTQPPSITTNHDKEVLDVSDRSTKPSPSSSPIMVLGGGVHRIGSSIEYDWSTSNCVRTLQKLGHATLLVNYNPDLVVVREDEIANSHRFYFEELTLERLLDIGQVEHPSGIILSMGGQIPLNLGLGLHEHGLRILGTTAENIDLVENRMKFSTRMDELGVAQPLWRHVTQVDEAVEFAQSLGYPVLIRPSYVLAGTAFNLAYNQRELEAHLIHALDASAGHPVLLTQFIENAKEIDIDGVADKGQLVAHAAIEKIESAGIHSGDSTLVCPSREFSTELHQQVRSITEQVVRGLQISGPFSLQLAHREDLGFLVIACNPRASRNFPFVSKTLNVNFVEEATKILCGAHVESHDPMKRHFSYECVKIPQFSFARVAGADPFPNVEMTSTGEVACFGENRYYAYLEGIQALYGVRLRKGKNVLIGSDEKTPSWELLEIVRRFHRLGYTIYGDSRITSIVNAVDPSTPIRDWERELLFVVSPTSSPTNKHTSMDPSSDLRAYQLHPSIRPPNLVSNTPSTTTTPTTTITSETTSTSPTTTPSSSILSAPLVSSSSMAGLALRPGVVDLVVSLGRLKSLSYHDPNYVLRRQAIDFGIPIIHDTKCALLFTKALEKITIATDDNNSLSNLKMPTLRSWKDYVRGKP